MNVSMRAVVSRGVAPYPDAFHLPHQYIDPRVLERIDLLHSYLKLETDHSSCEERAFDTCTRMKLDNLILVRLH